MTWFTAAVGSSSTARTLLQLPVATVAFSGAILVIVGGSLATMLGRSEGTVLVSVVATALSVLCGLAILLGELGAGLVSDGIVPVAAQRLTFSSGAGPGAWLALGAALAIAAATTESVRRRVGITARGLWETGRLAVVSVVALALSAAWLLQLRQRPWLAIPRIDGHVSLSAAALPCVVLLTFAGVSLLFLAVGLAAFGRFELSALSAASGGWLGSACAGVVGATPKAFVDTPLNVHTTVAVWLAYGLGFAVAAIASALLWSGRSTA
jgi:hypothetical protein